MHPRPTHKAALLALAVLFTPAGAAADEEAQTRVSQAPIDLEQAWEEVGFRMQLRFSYERLQAVLPAPTTPAFAVGIEPSYRLRERLSLGLGLRYSVLLGNWTGLRWNATTDATWHPAPGLSLGGGVGVGGIIGTRVAYNVVHARDGSFETSEGPEASRLQECSGHGLLALGRAGYLIVIGELFATGPVVQLDLQRTRCRGKVLAGDARSEVWWQPSWQLSWAFTWR